MTIGAADRTRRSKRDGVERRVVGVDLGALRARPERREVRAQRDGPRVGERVDGHVARQVRDRARWRPSAPSGRRSRARSASNVAVTPSARSTCTPAHRDPRVERADGEPADRDVPVERHRSAAQLSGARRGDFAGARAHVDADVGDRAREAVHHDVVGLGVELAGDGRRRHLARSRAGCPRACPSRGPPWGRGAAATARSTVLSRASKRERRIARDLRDAAREHEAAAEAAVGRGLARVERHLERRHGERVVGELDGVQRAGSSVSLSVPRVTNVGPRMRRAARLRRRVERDVVDDELRPELAADGPRSRGARLVGVGSPGRQDAGEGAQVEAAQRHASRRVRRLGPRHDDVVEVHRVAEEVSVERPFAVRRRVRRGTPSVERRARSARRTGCARCSASAGASGASCSRRGASSGSATARTRVAGDVDLGARDEPRVGLEVVEVARHVRDARHAPLDLGRERAQRVDPRQRNALAASRSPPARRRAGATPTRAPSPSRRRASPSGGCALSSTNERRSTSAPAMPRCAVVPAERGLRVALGEALAVERHVAQVALRADGDEASAARVLRAAERHVHVGARGHRGVDARRSAGRRRARTSRARRAGRTRRSRRPRRRRSPARRRSAAWRSGPRTGSSRRLARTLVMSTSGLSTSTLTWPALRSPNCTSATAKPASDVMSPSGFGRLKSAVDVRARLELAAHGHRPDGREVVEVGLEVRARRRAGRCGTRWRQNPPSMRECGSDRAHVAEPERLGPDAEVGRELRLGEAEEALARVVLGGAVVDAERVRLRREVAVDLEGREGARDGRARGARGCPSRPTSSGGRRGRAGAP